MKTTTALALILSLHAFVPAARADDRPPLRSLELRLRPAEARPEVSLRVPGEEQGYRHTTSAAAPIELTPVNVVGIIGVVALAGFFVYVAFAPR